MIICRRILNQATSAACILIGMRFIAICHAEEGWSGMAKDRIKLPNGFEKTELSCVGFEHGNEILGYCQSCANNSDCGMNHELRLAMGNDYPYWSEKFVAVSVPTQSESYRIPERKVFCADYASPQLKLPGIGHKFSDGVERLVELAEKEQNAYYE